MALPPGLAAPSPNNLVIGRGFILIQPTGYSSFFHVGNAPSFSITPKNTFLDHFSAMTRTLVRDARVTIKQELDFKMALEEMTAQNLALLFSGVIDPVTSTALQPVIDIMSLAQITCALKFFATNDIGPRYYINFPQAVLETTGAFDAIGEKFASMEISGSVNFTNNVWGTMTLEPPVGTIAPENVLAPYVLSENGTLVHGATFDVILGGWIGATSFTYQWNLAGTPISGATSPTYLTTAAGALTCTVTGTNAIGSTVATTPAVTLT